MGRLTAPSKPLTTGDAANPEEFCFASACTSDLGLLSGLGFLAFSFFALCSPVSGACLGRSRRVVSFSLLFFLSHLAIASASQGAFTPPPDAGRLLGDCAEPWSPAMSAKLRPVSADSSYCSM